MAKLTFLGACGTVTGSATLLSWGAEKILVDCGFFQGPEEIEAMNWIPFPFDPAELSFVIVTHAHLDHTGRLPRLVAQGYQGPIYCSRASKGLISLVLQDAGKLQEEEARYARRKGYSRHRNPQPLFTSGDVKKTLRLLHRLDFDQDHELLPGIRVRLHRAGHLLGAASLAITAKGADGKRRTWGFSGDVGRYGVPILQDPIPIEGELAGLILESTYGDRRHVLANAKETLRKLIDSTFARGGSVLIPAFALGRTQEVLYHLAALADEGALDPGVVFLDSPMAIKATNLYRQAHAEHDEEMLDLVEQDLGPLRHDRFAACRSPLDSKKLNRRKEPCVIVASSGMANGGRIVHHLLHRLPDAKNAVIFVGYQAAGTRGRALVDGADRVAIHGLEVAVKAEIRYLHTLSAHADCDELIRWCTGLSREPGKVFLNHGEDPQRKALAAALTGRLSWTRPELPEVGHEVAW
jgi:metallo-beta-lactamase family protein